jgi:hypothetical protein
MDDRDSRETTFSCSVCGGAGTLVFEDPGKRGLQHDVLQHPHRHPAVALRNHDARLRALPIGRKSPRREDFPQRGASRSVKEPSYRLKPMPFSIFGDLPALALLLEVGCVGCRSRKIVQIGPALAPRIFARAHFLCTTERAAGLGTCGGTGVPQLTPAIAIDRTRRFATLTCPACVPPWTARDVVLDQPPWSIRPITPATERYLCPSCGGPVRATFHGADRRSA